MRKSNIGIADISDKVVEYLLKRLEPIFERLDESSKILADRIDRTPQTLDVVMMDMGPNPISLIRILKNREKNIASLAELKDAMFKGMYRVAHNLDYEEANDLADKLRYWEAKILIVPSGITPKLPEDPKKKKKRIPFYKR